MKLLKAGVGPYFPPLFTSNLGFLCYSGFAAAASMAAVYENCGRTDMFIHVRHVGVIMHYFDRAQQQPLVYLFVIDIAIRI